jgi:hypothetical protein
MSFEFLHHRRSVEIIPVARPSIDEYGNEVNVEQTPIAAMAWREQTNATEDVSDRDQQVRSFRYFFKANVTINGRDKIRDEGRILRVVGEPEKLTTQLRVHHIEVNAELIDG